MTLGRWDDCRVEMNQEEADQDVVNSCQTATEHIHMNCTNKNNDKISSRIS